MKLEWKSYGDTGRTAMGDKGRWRVITDGRWWHLTLDASKQGKFVDLQRAVQVAQERDDAVDVPHVPMNGCGCWCFHCTNRNAGWHCHTELCNNPT